MSKRSSKRSCLISCWKNQEIWQHPSASQERLNCWYGLYVGLASHGLSQDNQSHIESEINQDPNNERPWIADTCPKGWSDLVNSKNSQEKMPELKGEIFDALNVLHSPFRSLTDSQGNKIGNSILQFKIMQSIVNSLQKNNC